ncbi:hypothetical protein [Streptomyces sp. NPDC018000]|uniref:hypothetical protein n=1 Tax=Streptomyces sp. NPDC018000 TaxID=3365028 RepID=UPI003788F5A3
MSLESRPDDNARPEWAEQVGRDGFALLDAIDDAFAPAWLGKTLTPAMRHI